MVKGTMIPCPLCMFRNFDADGCRHGAQRLSQSIARCNGDGREFDPKLLAALMKNPVYQALMVAPQVYEPQVTQVESRLDYRLNISYRYICNQHKRPNANHPMDATAYLELGSLEDLDMHPQANFGQPYDERYLAEAPECLQRAARALCADVGFRVINVYQGGMLLKRGYGFKNSGGTQTVLGYEVELSYQTCELEKPGPKSWEFLPPYDR